MIETIRDHLNIFMQKDTVEKTEYKRDLEDWELVQNLFIEKESCFSELVRRHYQLVVNIGYRFFSDMQLARIMLRRCFSNCIWIMQISNGENSLLSTGFAGLLQITVDLYTGKKTVN